ncbi:MAG: hypothetical protein WBM41_18630 [Arenicellales bacterium]
MRWIWVALGLLVAIAIGVMVALPVLINKKDAAPLPAEITPSLVKPAEQTVSAMSVASHDAGIALQEFLRIRAQPQLANAEVWAPEDWQRALDSALSGDDHYGHKRFSEALSAYQEAWQQLNALLGSRAQRLADNLEAGERSLEQDQSAQAVEAFERALAIEPQHDIATRGLARARSRDQVLALMETGQQAQNSNDLEAAATAYAEANRLDPVYQPASEALERIKVVIAELAFERAMSRALENLQAGNLTVAAQALEVATQLDPDAPAVADTRRRLEEARRLAALSRLREEAGRMVAQEEWSSASETYKKALQIDGQASFAVTGLAMAENRISLHAQLDHYLADLDRLSSGEPLGNAKKLIGSNLNLPESEPQLASKIEKLSEAISLAEMPVTLVLQSDNQTEITIYHVGRLGKFEEKIVTLKPGSYTVTGFCPGYRDVRKVIKLTPGSGKTSLLLRCEELI